MPRDPYLSFVQHALEQRLEKVRIESGAGAAHADSGPQAADGSSVELGDQLFEQFGPDDFEWMTTVVEEAITTLDNGKHQFGTTPAQYRLGDRARVVLLADWGTGTPRAKHIAQLAGQKLGERPDVDRHLIHLGDVYYCGLPSEYDARFLGDWPGLGMEGVTSWNLNGNHDMYSGGHGYFDVVTKGLCSQQQGTSCFRLFNDHWQFIALDTAYADNDLYDTQLPWLTGWAAPDGSSTQRKTVLLSHHQLGSSRAQTSVGPGIREKTAQLRESGRIHAWFWGHEHRCFIYEPYLGVACPVCLGNGGVPELLSHRLTLVGAFSWLQGTISTIKALFRPRVPEPSIEYEPPKPDVDRDGLQWEKLGFVVIDLDGGRGGAAYIDEDGTAVPISAFGADQGP